MSADEQLTLEIRNWRKFQHYNPDLRTPPWIKIYTELHHDQNYLSLTGHQRAVLIGLWITCAQSPAHRAVTTSSPHAHLVVTTASLSRQLALRVMTRDLEALNHAGFITILASTALAARLQDASHTRPHIEEEKNLTKAFNKTRTEEQRPGEIKEEQEQELSERVLDLERELADSLDVPW